MEQIKEFFKRKGIVISNQAAFMLDRMNYTIGELDLFYEWWLKNRVIAGQDVLKYMKGESDDR